MCVCCHVWQELDESGWKQVHGDVFRPPPHLSLFCALVGTGLQLATMTLSMILFATATTLYMGRGAIFLSFLVAYCLTSVVAGYSSGGLYSRLRGQAWISCLLYTVVLFPSLCLGLTLLLNCVAVFYHSLATVPFMPLVIVGLIWLFVSVPLCVMGTIVGRNWAGVPNDPCRVNAIPRLIPERRWFARPAVLIALGGVLPFGSIFIEMCTLPSPLFRSLQRFSKHMIEATDDMHCNVVALTVNNWPRRFFCELTARVMQAISLRYGRNHCACTDFVFTSFWNYKFYYVYGFMLLVFIILAIVTICVTIVVTYFLLNNEDYRWPWTSFASSASTAAYVLLYSVYYFFMKTKMSGFFQTLFYFSCAC